MAPPRPAAVLVPIVLRAELTVLLTQRSHDMPSHPGQISFPGGKVERCDADPLDCALREAQRGDRPEPPTSSSRSAISTATAPAPASRSARWWPSCGRASQLVLDPREVLEVFEVPLAFLMDEANHQKASREWRGRRAILLCHALRGALYLGRDRRHAQEHAPEAVSAMIRVVIENILLFLLPTAIYVGYVLLTRRSATSAGDGHQRGAAGVAVRRRRAAAWRPRSSTTRPSRRAARRARPIRRRA